jgi:hypothetical protein
MEEDGKKNVVSNFEAGSNCQVLNGNNSGCVFAMPGAMVTQQAAPPQPNDSGPQEECVVPEVLAESELWQKVKEAGLVDADGQPTVSRTEAALLANMLAQRLGITNKWKVFERLWHRNNMRGDYNSALEQRKSLEIQERLKNILD